MAICYACSGCGRCAETLKRIAFVTCPHCGKKMEAEDATCPSCGKRIKDAEAVCNEQQKPANSLRHG